MLPLWLAPWLLCSILLELLSATMWDVLQLAFPNWSAAWLTNIMGFAAPLLGDNPIMLKLGSRFRRFWPWFRCRRTRHPASPWGIPYPTKEICCFSGYLDDLITDHAPGFHTQRLGRLIPATRNLNWRTQGLHYESRRSKVHVRRPQTQAFRVSKSCV